MTSMQKIIIYSLLMLLLFGCQQNDDPVPVPAGPTPYAIEVPFGFPQKMNIPDDNPMTEEGVELGRYLFYDGRLSGRTHPDSLMSCATCHLQERSFECGIDHPEFIDGRPHGLTGHQTPHYMLPLINLVWNMNGYLWNGRVSEDNPNPYQRNIEDLVWMGVVASHEMNGDTNRTKALIASIPGYRDMFKKAFGTEVVSMERISMAVAQFIRTMVSANSKFDRYMKGEEQLSPSELNGFVLFTTEEGADCFHCHGGFGNPLFTTNLFYNNGKDSVFEGIDDRFAITGDPMDQGAYKATTLRNIELTGPYMHDGRFSTLEEVVDFYAHGLLWSPYINPLMHHIANGGTQLIPTEKTDLIAFIKALRDEPFLTDPAYGSPLSFPE
ncbi:MAG: cytochrome-c peroxidase [Bacteroidetes bacterium]|nr:MAG: cytochrome-c peroxidase [Bacteroidota bacterium]